MVTTKAASRAYKIQELADELFQEFAAKERLCRRCANRFRSAHREVFHLVADGSLPFIESNIEGPMLPLVKWCLQWDGHARVCEENIRYA